MQDPEPQMAATAWRKAYVRISWGKQLLRGQLIRSTLIYQFQVPSMVCSKKRQILHAEERTGCLLQGTGTVMQWCHPHYRILATPARSCHNACLSRSAHIHMKVWIPTFPMAFLLPPHYHKSGSDYMANGSVFKKPSIAFLHLQNCFGYNCLHAVQNGTAPARCIRRYTGYTLANKQACRQLPVCWHLYSMTRSGSRFTACFQVAFWVRCILYPIVKTWYISAWQIFLVHQKRRATLKKEIQKGSKDFFPLLYSDALPNTSLPFSWLFAVPFKCHAVHELVFEQAYVVATRKCCHYALK